MQAGTVESEFESLMAEHGRAVRAAVRGVLGRSGEADDLVQEVFTRLFVRLGQPGSFAPGPWCRRTARNLAIDHIRRTSAVPAPTEDLERACGDGLDLEVAGRETAERLAGSLSRLPRPYQRVLLAQLDPGLAGRPSHACLGAELGLSAKATESLLARARQRLQRELLRPQPPGRTAWRLPPGLEVLPRA